MVKTSLFPPRMAAISTKPHHATKSKLFTNLPEKNSPTKRVATHPARPSSQAAPGTEFTLLGRRQVLALAR